MPCAGRVGREAPRASRRSAATPPSVRRGRSFTATSSSPWMAFEVSQTMMTLQPLCFSMARCGCIAPSRPRPTLTSRLVECQPETKRSPYAAKQRLQRRAVVGPACGPSRCRQSRSAAGLVQACAPGGMSAPRRLVVVVGPGDGVGAVKDHGVSYLQLSTPLGVGRLLRSASRAASTSARADDLGHRHIPPVPARARSPGPGRCRSRSPSGWSRPLAAASAASSSAMSAAFTACAPIAAAWATKSISGWVRRDSCRRSRLLNAAPPVAFCSRLMQP